MKQTICVTIGRNVGGEPMPLTEWVKFKQRTRKIVSLSGTLIYNTGLHDGVGIWDSGLEAAACYVALAEGSLAFTMDQLEILRREYKQDAIGFIVAEGHSNIIPSV